MSGGVSSGLNSIWRKTGLVHHRVNATKFRRTGVKAVQEGRGCLEREIADLMGHLKATADKVYHIKKHEKSAIATAAGLDSILSQAPLPHKKVFVRHELSSAISPGRTNAQGMKN